jgi:hypothetical protein
LLIPLLLAACAHSPAPTEQFGASRATIQAAQSEGANDGSPEMALAHNKLARAEAAAKAHDQVTARRLAQEAAVDAQVARSRIEADKSSKAASEIDASMSALREELSRSAPAGGNAVTP